MNIKEAFEMSEGYPALGDTVKHVGHVEDIPHGAIGKIIGKESAHGAFHVDYGKHGKVFHPTSKEIRKVKK